VKLTPPALFVCAVNNKGGEKAIRNSMKAQITFFIESIFRALEKA
jgi:hypothetical protein